MSKELRSYTLDKCFGYIFHLVILNRDCNVYYFSTHLQHLYDLLNRFVDLISQETNLSTALTETRSAASAITLSAKPYILAVF